MLASLAFFTTEATRTTFGGKGNAATFAYFFEDIKTALPFSCSSVYTFP
jgi:hypothetical protein